MNQPENLLFETPEETSLLKVMDFGLSFIKGTEDPMVGLLGSIDYLAPEALLRRTYLPATDMWAIGVILYILLCGYPPFYAQSMQAKQEAIVRGKFDFDEKHWGSISPEAKALIARLLSSDPAMRPSAAEVAAHPWVRVGGNASPVSLHRSVTQRLKLFNARRKFRVAGYAVLVGNLARMRLQLVGLLGSDRHHMSPEELEAMQRQFNKHSTGALVTRQQFEDVLRELKIVLPAVDRVFQLFDTDSSGTVVSEAALALSVSLRLAPARPAPLPPPSLPFRARPESIPDRAPAASRALPLPLPLEGLPGVRGGHLHAPELRGQRQHAQVSGRLSLFCARA